MYVWGVQTPPRKSREVHQSNPARNSLVLFAPVAHVRGCAVHLVPTFQRLRTASIELCGSPMDNSRSPITAALWERSAHKGARSDPHNVFTIVSAAFEITLSCFLCRDRDRTLLHHCPVGSSVDDLTQRASKERCTFGWNSHARARTSSASLAGDLLDLLGGVATGKFIAWRQLSSQLSGFRLTLHAGSRSGTS